MPVFPSIRSHFEQPALWVKQYQHPIRVFGAILFGLALLTGIFWLFGSEAEPLAFVFGMLSSLCFASSSIANYIIPDRKPVSLMSYEEILAFIPSTDPVADWHGYSTEWVGEKFLKEDPRLRFRAKFTEDGIQNNDVVEPWVNCYPNKSATGYWYDLIYDGAFIDRRILVSVDSGRALLPMPKGSTMQASQYHYFVAKIHDSLDNLDEHLARSSITIE